MKFNREERVCWPQICGRSALEIYMPPISQGDWEGW